MFALGLVLYELLTGVRPFKRDGELATLMAAIECVIEPPSAVIEMANDLDVLVMRALAKTPADRYPDARAFQLAIEDFLTQNQLLASSVQLSELMSTLFADRIAKESAAGAPLVELDAPPPEQTERPAMSTAPRTPKRRPVRSTSSSSMPEAPPRSVPTRKSTDRSWAAAPAPVVAAAAPTAAPVEKRGGRRWLAAVVLLAALGAGGGWWWQHGGGQLVMVSSRRSRRRWWWCCRRSRESASARWGRRRSLRRRREEIGSPW